MSPRKFCRRALLQDAGALGLFSVLPSTGILSALAASGCKNATITTAEKPAPTAPPVNAGQCPAGSLPYRSLVSSNAQGVAGATGYSDNGGFADTVLSLLGASSQEHESLHTFPQASRHFHFNMVATEEAVTRKHGDLHIRWKESATSPWREIRIIPASAQADTNTFVKGHFESLIVAEKATSEVHVRIEGLPSSAVAKVEVLAEVDDAPPLALDYADTGGAFVPPGFSVPPKDFVIVPRAQWNATPPKEAPEKASWTKIVVHHSAIHFPSGADAGSMARSFQRSHLSQGWNDIGYNFLVAPDGRVLEGRAGGKNTQGAHTYKVNEKTVGINFMGQFSEPDGRALGLNQPTQAQIESGAKLIAWLAHECGIDLAGSGPLAPAVRAGVDVPNLTTHAFVGANLVSPEPTSCPGSLMIKKIPSMKESAVGYMAQYSAKAAPTTTAVAAPVKPACSPSGS